jgi:type I restriction enzyme, S subunit
MKHYSNYKQTGIEWIGEIPEHWKIQKIKEIKSPEHNAFVDGPFGSNLKSEHFIEDGDVIVIESGFVTSGKFIEKEFKTISFEHFETIRRSECKENDIIISKIGANYGTSAILPKFPKLSVISGNTLKLSINHNISYNTFVNYALQVIKTCRVLELIVSINAQPALTLGDMNNVKIPFPPLPEQKAIAEYLDKTTGAIDSTIAIKEKQIETIEQYFRSKLHEVVTGGLNPNVKRKPSGVDWIGEIPEHWKVKRLKDIANIRYGLGQPPQEKDDGLPLIRATNIYYGKIHEEKMIFVDPNAIPPGRDAVLKEGEIIIVRSGAYTGDSAIIPKRYEGAITGYDMVLTVTQAYNKFIAWQILTEFVQEHQFVSQSQRAAQPHLNAEQLGKTIVVIPPLSEQKAIAEYLDTLREKVESITKTLREQVEVLKEYRKSLIHECVTGKRKVV